MKPDYRSTPFEAITTTNRISLFLNQKKQKHTKELDILTNFFDLKFVAISPERRNDLPLRYLVSLYGNEEKIQGHGSAFDDSSVFEKALGEYIERYVSLGKDYREKSRVREVGERTFFSHFFKTPYIGISDIPGRFSWQQPKETKDYVERFISGRNILTNKKVFLNEDFVYWEYNKNYPITSASHVLPFTTSGAGAGETLEQALISASAEVLERDQFLINWIARSGFTKIDTATIPKTYMSYKEMRNFFDVGIDVYLYDMRRDTKLPAFTVVLVDRRQKPFFLGLGAAVKKNPDEAISAALAEAVEVLEFALSHQEKTIQFDTQLPPFSQRTMRRTDRLCLWKDDFITHAHWMLVLEEKKFDQQEYEQYINISQEAYQKILTKDLLTISHMSGAKNYGVYYHNFKNPFLRLLKKCVVRVVVPGAFSLYLDEHTAHVANIRLAKALGLKSVSDITEEMVNVYPHPFP